MNTQEEIFERIKRNVHEKFRRRNIICPHCDTQQDSDTMYGHVSYWGEEPPFECQCDKCGKEFMVKEEVSREFICTKIEGGNQHGKSFIDN